jgi:hypothetical protein
LSCSKRDARRGGVVGREIVLLIKAERSAKWEGRERVGVREALGCILEVCSERGTWGGKEVRAWYE